MANQRQSTGGFYIFRRWVTGKNGQRIYPIPPKKALRIWVGAHGEPKKKQ